MGFDKVGKFFGKKKKKGDILDIGNDVMNMKLDGSGSG